MRVKFLHTIHKRESLFLQLRIVLFTCSECSGGISHALDALFHQEDYARELLPSQKQKHHQLVEVEGLYHNELTLELEQVSLWQFQKISDILEFTSISDSVLREN